MAHITYFGADKSGRVTTCQIKTSAQDMNAPCQLHVNGHDTDKTRLTKNVFANAPLKDLFEDEVEEENEDAYIFDSAYYNRDKEAPKVEEEATISALDYLKEANAGTEYDTGLTIEEKRAISRKNYNEDIDAVASLSNLSLEEQVALGGLPSAYKIEQLTSDAPSLDGKPYPAKIEKELLDNAIKLIAIVEKDAQSEFPIFSEETHKAAVRYRKALLDPTNLDAKGSPKLVYDVEGSNSYRGGLLKVRSEIESSDIGRYVTPNSGVEESQTLQSIYLGVKYEAIKDKFIAENLESIVSEKVGRSTHFIEEHNRYAEIRKEPKGLFARLFNR